MKKNAWQVYQVGLLATMVVVGVISESRGATIAYWRFEDGLSGNPIPSATDSTANANTMSIVSDPAFDSTVFGATVPEFNSANTLSAALDGGDYFMDANPETSVLDTADFTDITVEGYVNFGPTLEGVETLVGMTESTNDNGAVEFQDGFYLNQFFNSEFRCELATVGGDYLIVTSPNGAAQPDTWYHLAVVGDSTAGTLTLYVNGEQVGQVTGFDGLWPDTGTWMIGASSIDNGNIVDQLNGGWLDEIRISNVALDPSQFLRVPDPAYYPIALTSLTPADTAVDVYREPTIEAVIADGTSTIDTSTVVLTFDGNDVTGQANITQNAGITTISYAAPVLDSESEHTVQVQASSVAPAYSVSAESTFTVLHYITVPAGWGFPLSAKDTGTRGFEYRDVKYDLGGTLPNTEARANAQLAGELTNPATGDLLLPGDDTSDDEAVYGQGEFAFMPEDYDDFFSLFGDKLETVNYNNAVFDIGGGAGNFADDFNPPFNGPEGLFPGIFNLPADDFADESIGFLELPAGFTTIGVNSDDGFVMYMGPQARDLLAADVGRFDGGRGPADTLFGLDVEQAGLYMFRLLHYQGGGGTSLELFTQDVNGDRTLVNDSVYGGVPAWRLANPGTRPYVRWLTPQETTIAQTPNHAVFIEVRDADTTLASHSLSLEGAPVATTMSKSGDITTITYSDGLPFNSTNHFTIVLGNGSETWTNDFEVVTGDEAGSVIFSATPTGLTINPVLLQVTLEDVVSQVETGSIQLYLDSVEVTPDTVQKVGGITTVNYAAGELALGPHTGTVIFSGTIPTVGPVTNDWTFNVVAAPGPDEDLLFNINFAGREDNNGDFATVPDGVVLAAGSYGANLWNNMIAPTIDWTPISPFQAADTTGSFLINWGWKAGFTYNHDSEKTFGSAADMTPLNQSFQGFGGFDATWTLSGLNDDAAYDIYVYFTWPYNENSVDYTIETGVTATPTLTIQPERDTANAYSNFVEGVNYVVFTAVGPVGGAIDIRAHNTSDGGFSAIQVHQYPALDFQVLSISPQGVIEDDSPTIEAVIEDWDQTVNPGDVVMTVDGGAVTPSASKVASTTTVSFAASNLSLGEHTVSVTPIPGRDPVEWTFTVTAPPINTADILWNVNIAGGSGGTLSNVTQGTVIVAPSTGSNLWNNLSGVSGAVNDFTVTDADGNHPIGFQTSGTHNWGTAENNAEFTFPELFYGWAGANAPMNMDMVFSGLNPNATYDLYLYSTWRWTENTVIYTVLEGSSVVTSASVTEARASVINPDNPQDYAGITEGDNYAVITSISPTTAGRIVLNGSCPDGVLSGLQLVQAPGAGAFPPQFAASPEGVIYNPVNVEVTLTDVEAEVDMGSIALFLDAGAVTPDSVMKTDGVTTITYAAGELALGEHTGMVVYSTTPDLGPLTNMWTFTVVADPTDTADILWNVNIASESGGTASNVTDGTVIVAPSTGANLWNNLQGVSGATNDFTVTDSDGGNAIGFQTTGTHNWGTAENNAEFTFPELFYGWLGANAPMDVDLVLSGLNPNATYDLYLYSTWRWTENTVVYSILEGSSIRTSASVTEARASVINPANPQDYSGVTEGANYAVFTSVSPTAAGRIVLNGSCPDGVLSGFQLVQLPGAGPQGPSLIIQDSGTAGVLRFAWPVELGENYIMEHSTDLRLPENWMDTGLSPQMDGGYYYFDVELMGESVDSFRLKGQ